MAYYCSQCNHFNEKDKNRYGEYWCNGWSCYVSPNKIANHCRKFCYIVTKVSQILGINDDIILKNQELITDYFYRNVDCFDFMEDYNSYGLEVANCIENDPDKEYTATYIYEHLLCLVSEKMNEGNIYEALDIYMSSFYDLANYYDVSFNDLEKKKFTRVKKAV